jgi:hypothetical protein
MHLFQQVWKWFQIAFVLNIYFLFYFIDSLEDGYEQLRDLVISYLGLEDDRLDAPRPNTTDEIKRFDDFDIQRSGWIY